MYSGEASTRERKWEQPLAIAVAMMTSSEGHAAVGEVVHLRNSLYTWCAH